MPAPARDERPRTLRGCIVALAAMVAAVVSSPAAFAGAAAEAVDRGVRYLESRQADNGGIPSAKARGHEVADALVALAASGRGGPAVDRALGRIAADGPASITRAGHAARIVMALVATGQDPRRFGGYDYVARITSSYQPASGAYDTGVYADALAVLGLQAAREPVPQQAITYLRANQCADGGFAHEAPCLNRPDVDTTSMVLSAFAAAGVPADDPARRNGRAWILAAQNASGGFGLEHGDPDNANSTGLVLSLVRALGEDAAAAPWTQGSKDPTRALLALQLSSGAFAYVAADPKPNDYATVQAVPGLAGMAWPPTASLLRSSASAAPAVGSASATEARTAVSHAPGTASAPLAPDSSGGTDIDASATVAAAEAPGVSEDAAEPAASSRRAAERPQPRGELTRSPVAVALLVLGAVTAVLLRRRATL